MNNISQTFAERASTNKPPFAGEKYPFLENESEDLSWISWQGCLGCCDKWTIYAYHGQCVGWKSLQLLD